MWAKRVTTRRAVHSPPASRAAAYEASQYRAPISAVTVSSVRGELLGDAGSGRVDAADIDGPEISIDTGSGSVTLTRAIVTGDVNVDTGSGRVMLDDVEGEEFMVDTGSGSVRLLRTRN